MEHSLPQRAAAETIGTALLVLVGPGSVVATLVLAGKSVPAITGADLLGISFAFGLIIAALVYAIGKVSGCHINPAVTFALAATKRFPWREVPAYWAAQVVGAVLGGLAIWALFAHTAIDLGMGQTSFNQDTTTWASAIFAEGIGTFMLMLAILGIVDSRSPNERDRSLTCRAIPATAARSSPRSAAAPASFSASTVAPTPRRPAV